MEINVQHNIVKRSLYVYTSSAIPTAWYMPLEGNVLMKNQVRRQKIKSAEVFM
jgi:hypothetical protein